MQPGISASCCVDPKMLSCWAGLLHAVPKDRRAKVDKLSCLQMRKAADKLQNLNPLARPNLEMAVNHALSSEQKR